ncbi:MAG: protein kinase [Pseudomonadota bacterium]
MRFLLVESDPRFQKLLSHHLSTTWSGAEVEVYTGFPDALKDVALLSSASLLIADFHLVLRGGGSYADRLAALGHVLETQAMPPVLLLADPSDELMAVAAIKAGAENYLAKRKLTGDLLRTTCVEAMRPDANSERKAPTTPTSPAKPVRGRRRLEDCPTIVGYQPVRTLGAGAMASVYLAHSEELGENVVLKVMWRNEQTDQSIELFKRFEREYELIAKTNRAEVVDIYEYGVADSYAYIAMEYFPVGDLQTRLQNPVSVSDSISYTLQILSALEVIHDLGVFHRDLKPANVMVRADNSLALIDFGTAKYNEDNGLTNTGESFGTPTYLSPEQALGQQCDARSDLYAVAIMLFEMLTGKAPYVSNNLMDLLDLHVAGAIPTLPDRLAPFQTIINVGLAKKKSQRFQSANDFAEALKQVESSMSLDKAS